MILGHNDKPPAVELFVAEIDDFGVATVMLPQQGDRCLRPDCQRRGKQIVQSKVVTFIQMVLLPDRFRDGSTCILQGTGELLQIADNDDAARTGHSQHTGG